MRQFEERRKLKRILFSRPVFFLLLTLVFLLVPSLYKVYKKSRQAVLISNQIEQEIESVEERRSKLETNIKELETEEGKEKELRTKFQIKKLGEDYVVLVEEGGGAAGQGKETENKHWLIKLFDFFR